MADRLWFVLLGMFIVHTVAGIVLKSWGFGLPAIMLGVWLVVSALSQKDVGAAVANIEPCP